MPIYAYKCSTCGYAKDVLQKLSDPQLTRCPECGAETFSKQVTAAGFQLKGSGWYVTDFRDGGKKPEGKGASGDKSSGGGAEGKSEGKAEGGSAKSDAPASAPAASAASAPASSPSTSSGTSTKKTD